MFRPVRFLSTVPKIRFMAVRRIGLAVSALLVLASVGLFLVNSLNYGIDFRGGILVEVRTDGPADLASIRSQIGALQLGDVQVQEFGAPNDVLIRIGSDAEGEAEQIQVIEQVRSALGAGVEYRRVEFVGPQVGSELIRAGTLAVTFAIIGIMLYIWLRFEWQFAIGATVATIHDVIVTIGLFALLQLEFNLSTVAAILTIAGYSVNDTVVVYDRVRENLRKYKVMSIVDLLDVSMNETLSRTIMTSVSTLLALGALYMFGGEVIRGFALALIWGVVIGTFSSVFLATPLLLAMNLRRGITGTDGAAEAGGSDARPAA